MDDDLFLMGLRSVRVWSGAVKGHAAHVAYFTLFEDSIGIKLFRVFISILVLYSSLACQWDCLQKMEHHPCVKMR